jgi:ABC-type amino acid transport substrate-binding protein
VGVVIEDYTAQFLEDHQLNAILVPYADYESLVLGAINHDVDAFIMEAPVALNYLAKHDGLKTVHRVEKPLYTKGFLAGVKDGSDELVQQINKGISAISSEELALIVRNWTGLPESHSNKIRQVTVVTSDDHIPYYYMDEQQEMTGMLIDIWRLWSKKTGIDVKFSGLSFSDSLATVRDGAAEIHGGWFYSEPAGLFADLWQLWARTTGEKIELRGYQWQDGFTAVRNGDADIHAGLSKMSANTESLEFATPVYEFPVHLFFHSNR